MAPEYLAEKHSAYVDYILKALALPSTRNIAVSGAYGTGKSSVLLGLAAETKSHHFLQVSLTELARTDAEFAIASGERTVTAALQKEVVKRLLYSVRPSRLPRSRFTRIRGPRVLAIVLFSVILASVLTLAAIGFAIQSPIDDWAIAIWPTIGWLGRVGDLVSIAAVAFGLQMIWSGTRVSEVALGPAKIAMKDGAGNYFDQYLDELIYFFEKTATDVVVFEDLDRFQDPGIFQELRELNGLLNNAQQVSQRVVFVYAMRDSLFRATANSQAGMAGVDTPASDRAKFFDLIVPIAPFISSEVGSDLLSQEFDDVPAAFRPGNEVIRLAGRRFADMRVIRSIRNEYLVFRRTVFDVTRVAGLSQDQLFAIILFKHQYLTDFELIRTADSSLDRLVRKVTDLASSRSAGLDTRIAALSDELAIGARATERAQEAGDRLVRGLNDVLALTGNQVIRVDIAGEAFPISELGGTAFWQALADSAHANTAIHLSSGGRVSTLAEM